MLNVKFGRWQNLAQATIDVALGKYGRPPGAINGELLALARRKSGQEPVEGRPADSLAPRMASLKEELVRKRIDPSDDNAVLYAMFPRETDALYNGNPAARAHAPQPVAVASPTPLAALQKAAVSATARAIRRFYITVNNHRSEVLVEEVG